LPAVAEGCSVICDGRCHRQGAEESAVDLLVEEGEVFHETGVG
jgi:hypothetical protein